MATLGQRGDKLDLLIRQGATLGPFLITMTNEEGVATDLTGATVRSTVLSNYDSLVRYDLEINVTDAVAGKFSIGMPAILTATLPYLGDLYEPENQYVWDLEIEFPDGRVIPVFWGAVKIAPEATK